jgi:hypothetical protein
LDDEEEEDEEEDDEEDTTNGVLSPDTFSVVTSLSSSSSFVCGDEALRDLRFSHAAASCCALFRLLD